MANSAYVVRGAVPQSSPPYVMFSFAVFDEAGNLLVGPDNGTVGVLLEPGATTASLETDAQEAILATLAQNFPSVDTTGMSVVVL